MSYKGVNNMFLILL